MDQFASNISVLRRWAAVSDQPLPPSFKSFRDKYPTDAFAIQQKDPELCVLLSGQAPAGLVADVLSGQWPEAAPTLEERQQQADQDELQRLYDSKPFGGRGPDGDPLPENVTAQMRLAALSPDVAERSRTEATNSFSPENPDLAAKIRAAAVAERKRAVTESHEHGQRLAKAQYPRVAAIRQQQQWEAARAKRV
ncbi:hypothetical protein [Synechococcus sp. A15-60]|uniref:hypothetical protein n=1 Tax=Synechococcus sp. A15-60 TaxID=1050655 RepID=UPI0016452140|nr:hypothetical protein [Synechococcus sp. A15-60]QNI48852.1 hypothetical protein SynA1560_02203 [Synechococcus sp. A15-60]